jgi:hypothetical protein
MVQLATALVVGRAIERLMRNPAGAALAGAALGIAATIGTARAYVADPLPFFRLTKTLRDVRGLMRIAAERTADAPPGWRWFLLLEKKRPGHLANPTLAFYLERWRLADRVMLAGIEEPAVAARTLAQRCAGGCRGRAGIDLHVAFDVRDPYDQTPRMRKLLHLALPAWADDIVGVGVIAWSGPPPNAPGLRATRLDGITLVEPAARGARSYPFQTGALGRVAYVFPPWIQSGPVPQKLRVAFFG